MADATSDAKRRIKKLTAEKVAQFRDEIVKRDGQQVDLTGRGIESIVSFEGLQTATKLDLSHNKLTKLSQLKAVPRVTMLKLTGNKFSGDGLAEIQHLKKLVILNAAENHVTRIPFEVLRNVRTLKALVLNNNAISALDWMPKLPELNSLIVSNNRITQIPQRVLDGLPSLKKISISHNLLEEIPNMSQLSEITELRLSHNKIKKIPAHLAQLTNLKVLELSHNQIDDWSGLEALSSLENLRQLNLIGNPICGKKLEVPVKEGDDCDSDSGEDGSDEGDSDSEADKTKKRNTKKKADISEEEKQQIKEAKKLDAKHKQYNFKMKRLFPNLVVRDAARVLDKRVHGYVAPPKEEKPKQKKPINKKGNKPVTGKRKRDEDAKKAKADKKTPKMATSADKDNTEQSKKATKAVASTHESEKKRHKKQSESSKSTPMEVDQTASTSKSDDQAAAKTEKKATKEKKQKDKKDKDKKDKKDQRLPKEIASGVVAVKQFRKPKKTKTAESKRVDLTQINFTPDVGFGGSSAWD
ncbi:hypothetical protein PHMEG_0004420 [Phytophthora megakarya]|uniref:Protein phosphatase 1 regulatory subunit n=1 Tax=Phytophthora megakarya TaxID=4795 RepID=A0A225WTV7_9STRA|nr:hypothetical protein PHMEG_0004420 [Phytophthora megakarya]